MAEFIHLVSKDARRRIVAVLTRGRSMRTLARELGISPTAVHKYLTGKTHPSDEVVKRAIEIASYSERREIAKIIMEDLISGVESFVEWGIENSLLKPNDLRTIEDRILRAGLAIIGKRIATA